MKKNRMNDFSKFLMLAALIILMAGGYIVNRKKLQLREAANLPYYKIELSEIEDGIYTGKAETSFLHLELEIQVENHQIKDIKVLKNDGIDGEKARPIIDEMIAQNKIVVPAIKGAERGSLVYVSCASTALARK
jgi:uncharacterized protein with FMN-binding domain